MTGDAKKVKRRRSNSFLFNGRNVRGNCERLWYSTENVYGKEDYEIEADYYFNNVKTSIKNERRTLF